MSSDCPEEEDQPGDSVVSELEERERERERERFILQHNLRPGVPPVRLPRHLVSPSLQPAGGPSMPWPGGLFQPWLSEVDKLRLSGGPAAQTGPHMGFPFMAGPSHSAHPASAFSRPGFSTHTPREFLQRPDRIQPGFDRPLGQAGPAPTEIHHATPEPGEVTIEKCEPWTPAPAPAPATPTSTPPRQSPSRPSPPARRMRLRDILTSAVRSALGNQELDQEADRFNTEIGATFMNALGPVVKKEK